MPCNPLPSRAFFTLLAFSLGLSLSLGVPNAPKWPWQLLVPWGQERRWLPQHPRSNQH